jgi:choline dehydrogenase-like flavoprotein
VGTRPLRFTRRSANGNEDGAYGRYDEALGSFDFRPNRGAVFSAHQMGSVRMGADGTSHPCDPWGRVRQGMRGAAVVGGLYMGDGSVCPTALGVNPLLTIMALARRTARTILADR